MLHQCLRAIAVMDVPIGHQHAARSVSRQRVVRGDRHVAEHTETHPAIAKRMMPRRTHGREAPGRASVEGHIDTIEDTTNSGHRGIPRTLTDDGIRVELATACSNEIGNPIHVRFPVCKQQLVARGVSALMMQERVEQRRLFTKRARNRTQATHVLRMSPSLSLIHISEPTRPY